MIALLLFLLLALPANAAEGRWFVYKIRNGVLETRASALWQGERPILGQNIPANWKVIAAPIPSEGMPGDYLRTGDGIEFKPLSNSPVIDIPKERQDAMAALESAANDSSFSDADYHTLKLKFERAEAMTDKQKQKDKYKEISK